MNEHIFPPTCILIKTLKPTRAQILHPGKEASFVQHHTQLSCEDCTFSHTISDMTQCRWAINYRRSALGPDQPMTAQKSLLPADELMYRSTFAAATARGQHLLDGDGIEKWRKKEKEKPNRHVSRPWAVYTFVATTCDYN